MGAKLFHGLAMLGIVVMLSLLGLVGWMQATGRLSEANRVALLKILRGVSLAEEAPATAEADLAAEGEPAAVAVATQLAVSQQAADLADRLIEQRKEELAHETRLLASLQRRIIAERDELRKERQAWAEEILAHRERIGSESFKKQLKLYEKLQAKQVKDIFMTLGDQLAAEYLVAMSDRAAAKVIGQFRTPEEKTRLKKLLEQMRKDG